MSATTEYDDLGQLRQALNSNETGRMLDAADTVRDAGISVDAVLSTDPPREELVAAGIIPESGSSPGTSEQLARIIELLETHPDLGGDTA